MMSAMQAVPTFPALRHHHAHDGASARVPATRDELLARLFAGDLFVFAGTDASRALAGTARQCLADVLGPAFTAPGDPAGRAAWRCPALSANQVAALRGVLYAQPDLHARAAEVVASLGMREGVRVDAPRLRVITAGAEQDPAAAPVYVLHRDTWYGCSEAQVNWWIPIFETPEEQAFVFYPQYFDRAVPNTSASFDYEHWMGTFGWHGDAPLDAYPQPTEDVSDAPALGFDYQAGDILLFAAAHLHQTRPNPIPGTSRLSIDLRTVVEATPGLRAPNVDNASTGAADRVAIEFAQVSALLGPEDA